MKKLLLFIIFISLFCFFKENVANGTQIFATPSVTTETPQKETIENLQKKIDDVIPQVNLSARSEQTETAQKYGITIEELQIKTNKLRDLQITYQQHKTALEKNKTLLLEIQKMKEKKIDDPSLEISQKPPFNLSIYDQYLDQINDIQQQIESVNFLKNIASSNLIQAKSRLEESQKVIRNLRDSAQTSGTSSTTPQPNLNWSLEIALINEQLSQATYNYQKAQLNNIELELELTQLKKASTESLITWIKSNLQFDQSDIDRHIEDLENHSLTVQEKIEKIRAQQLTNDREYLNIQNQIEETTREEELMVFNSQLRELESWRDYNQKTLDMLEGKLFYLNQLKQAWITRNTLLAEKEEKDPIELREKREEASSLLKNLETLITRQQQIQENTQNRILALQKELSNQSQDLPFQLKDHITSGLRAREELMGENLEYLSFLMSAQQIFERLVAEINSAVGSIQIAQRVTSFWKDRLHSFWNIELYVIEDNPVTVRKVILAILIVVIGLLLIKFFTRSLQKKIAQRFDIEMNTASAIKRVVNYFFMLMIVLFALRTVNIPLTAFAFLGGALAVAIGLGSQNIFSNFLGGFVIVFQKPIKENDIIEIEGKTASVQEIGSRFTRLKTFDNIDILVPNNYFMNNIIVNWTNIDKTIRGKITVGVSYSSPVRTVEALLYQAMKENLKILTKPAPFVLFSDFRDSALIFNAFFWVDMNYGFKGAVESELRYRVLELFQANNIEISYPQKDIHIDSLSPIELKIFEPEKREENQES
jgi:potassium efflux system protein